MKRFFSRKLLSALTLSLMLSGCGLKSSAPPSYSVDLEVWGVFDDTDTYQETFAAYRQLNPYIRNINYRKLPVETYEQDLLNALAAGKGPDIFMIRNAKRSLYEDKLAPAPDYFINERQYKDAFVDVAGNDFVKDGKVYAVPLSVDSLALYYNKDLLNAAGIANPPTTWQELQNDVRRLTRIDPTGNITQSAAALGTAYNINRSTDILTAMMLQKGSNIADPSQQSDFTDSNSEQALAFYTQFAKLGSLYYSWNPRQHYSIDAFYEGKVAMMINYSWQYATLKQKNAKLNIGVAPLPQFENAAPVNFANYWGYAVGKNMPTRDNGMPPSANSGVDPAKKNDIRVHEAWQLLKFMTMPQTNKTVTLQNAISGTTKDFTATIDPAEVYLNKTMKPAARRDLIEKQKTDVVLAPFAAGNLIAKNWYQGNVEQMEAIFAEMIDGVNKGIKTTYEALATASTRVRQLNQPSF